MQAFKEFACRDASFWAFVKWISETLGYTEYGRGIVKSYTLDEIVNLCRGFNVRIDRGVACDAVSYSEMRADLLNKFVCARLH